MGFRYTLQSLLRLRKSLEHQEEQRLYAASTMVAQLKAKLEQLEMARAVRNESALREIEAGAFAATLQFAGMCDALARLTREKLQLQLAEAERQRFQQLREYRDARQKREIFEALREEQEAVYAQGQARREQQLADEAFLLHRHVKPE